MVLSEVRVEVVRIPRWNRFDWLRHGFSTRVGGVSSVYGDGDLNLGFTRDDSLDRVRENRRRFACAVSGAADVPVVAVRQVHGTTVRLVAAGEAGWVDEEGRARIEADGLMTASSGVLLGIQAADCVPVLVADTRQRVVAAFHAGWRGTVSGIVPQGVAQMQAQFGSRPEDLIGAVGPAIGSCCYTVGEEVWERFNQAYPYAADLFAQRSTGLHLDLAEGNRRQLVDAGLQAEEIAVVSECTACARLGDGRRKYFSHRAENGFTGRAMGMIGVASR
jgi:YfiH family protein